MLINLERDETDSTYLSFQMYQYVCIFCCFLISVSQSFTPNKEVSEPKTFRLIQNIVRHNYERSLKRRHQSLLDRNYPLLSHPPVKTPIRETRHLQLPKRTHRKINNFQGKADNRLHKPRTGAGIDRTFAVSKLPINKHSFKGVRPTFQIKPAGNIFLIRIVNYDRYILASNYWK